MKGCRRCVRSLPSLHSIAGPSPEYQNARASSFDVTLMGFNISTNTNAILIHFIRYSQDSSKYSKDTNAYQNRQDIALHMSAATRVQTPHNRASSRFPVLTFSPAMLHRRGVFGTGTVRASQCNVLRPFSSLDDTHGPKRNDSRSRAEPARAHEGLKGCRAAFRAS